MTVRKYIVILIIIASLSALLAQDVTFINDRWRKDDAGNNYLFSFNIGYNTVTHAYGEKNFKINDRFALAYGLVASSENDIGATSVRPHYPVFSTARFYRGELQIDLDSIKIYIGRHLQDTDPVHQASIWNRTRITGDGITWSWNFSDKWRFENSIEMLPAERPSPDQVFERVLNYHAFIREGKRLSLMIGELDVYTGTTMGINLVRSNPFLPYSVHLIDTRDTFYPGYSGDNENSMIIFGVNYTFFKNLSYGSYLYIDDIQIDIEDRSSIADSYLWFNELYYKYTDNFRVSLQFNLANPQVAWHNGPFTSFTVFEHELLPHSFGEIYSIGLNLNYRHRFFETYVHGKFMRRSVFEPEIENLFLWSVQESLEKINVLDLDIKTGFYLMKNMALWLQYRYNTQDLSAFNFVLQTNF